MELKVFGNFYLLVRVLLDYFQFQLKYRTIVLKVPPKIKIGMIVHIEFIDIHTKFCSAADARTIRRCSKSACAKR